MSPGSVSSIIRFGSTGPVSFHHVSFRVVSRDVRFCTLCFVSFPLVLVVLPFRFASFRFSHVPSRTFRFVSFPLGASNVIWLDITFLHGSFRFIAFPACKSSVSGRFGSYNVLAGSVSYRFQGSRFPEIPFRVVSCASVSFGGGFVSFLGLPFPAVRFVSEPALIYIFMHVKRYVTT